MARTGLRMMPTFPSPPLKFRTAGFPRYGFKASLSDSAFPDRRSVKPAPGIPSLLDSVCLRPSPASATVVLPGSGPSRPCASTNRCSRGPPLYPRGPWLRSELCCLDPSSLTTTPSASLAGTPRFHALPLIRAPSLCGSAEATRETFPTFTACFPRVPPTLPRRSASPSRCLTSDTRLPRPIKRVATARPVSASNSDGVSISRLHRSLYATARTFALPS